MRTTYILICLILFASCTTTSHSYYIVRHAEKEQSNTKDPVLTLGGQERARKLGELLKDKHIKEIYATNTARAKLTAEPLSKLLNIPISIYGPIPDSSFISKIKKLSSNVLVVGHSNTVDDIVNLLAGEKKLSMNLADDAYDNLFIITYKKKHIQFRQEKF